MNNLTKQQPKSNQDPFDDGNYQTEQVDTQEGLINQIQGTKNIYQNKILLNNNNQQAGNQYQPKDKNQLVDKQQFLPQGGEEYLKSLKNQNFKNNKPDINFEQSPILNKEEFNQSLNFSGLENSQVQIDNVTINSQLQKQENQYLDQKYGQKPGTNTNNRYNENENDKIQYQTVIPNFKLQPSVPDNNNNLFKKPQQMPTNQVTNQIYNRERNSSYGQSYSQRNLYDIQPDFQYNLDYKINKGQGSNTYLPQGNRPQPTSQQMIAMHSARTYSSYNQQNPYLGKDNQPYRQSNPKRNSINEGSAEDYEGSLPKLQQRSKQTGNNLEFELENNSQFDVDIQQPQVKEGNQPIKITKYSPRLQNLSSNKNQYTAQQIEDNYQAQKKRQKYSQNMSELPFMQHQQQMQNQDTSELMKGQDTEEQKQDLLLRKEFYSKPVPIVKAIKDQNQPNTYFYYELYPKYNKSQIVPSWVKDGCQTFFFQTIIPFVIQVCVQLAMWGIERKVNDFCYVNSVCPCSSWGSKFWSFFRQLVLFKLSNLSCKKIIIRKATKQNPYMEIFFIYFFTLGIDFIILAWIEVNKDWVYIILVFIIGIIIPTHTLRFKQFWKSMWEARGLWIYELTLFVSFIYAYIGIPAIFDSFVEEYGFENGKTYFIYLFPLFDVILDLIIDSGFLFANHGESYLYQVQQLQLGLRVGMIIVNKVSYFEFWYLLVTFTIIRISNSSQILYIAIRRMIYELAPPRLKKRLGMTKFTDEFSSKQGSYIENSVLWIIILTWVYFNENVQPPMIYTTTIINTCQFKINPVFSKEIPWTRILIVYLIFILGEFTGVFLNYETQYDTVKWYGYKDCNLYDNVVMRLAGWYIFQIGVFIPMTIIKGENDTIFLNLLNISK